MSLERLETGQWLGTQNRIRFVGMEMDGWFAVDSFGKKYMKSQYGKGLLVGDTPGTIDRENRTPWPEPPEAPDAD